jgi:MFS family permease
MGVNPFSVIQFLKGRPTLIALGLALGSCLGVSLARFSYSLFIPAMKSDLSWSYLMVGSMNTANALGYLLGAISLPFFIRRFTLATTFVVSGVLTSIFIGLCSSTIEPTLIFLLRLLAGICSAFVFTGGAILIAQLGSEHPHSSGWFIGIYYGGAGIGIIITSFLVPEAIALGTILEWEHPWQLAWIAISILGLLSTALMWKSSYATPPVLPRIKSLGRTPIKNYLPMVLAYFCFGMGYIGYMTFVISLLRQIGIPEWNITLFYATLGLFVIFSAKIWAKAFNSYKGGQTLALTNLLISIACFIPPLCANFITRAPNSFKMLMIFTSGMIFGACFISAVASTTAFVRHNLPQHQWVAGITVFTVTFAIGQVIGPSLSGWISDGSGGLARGLWVSGFILLLGSALAWSQKTLNAKTMGDAH